MKIQLAVSLAIAMLVSGQNLSLAQKFYLSPEGNNNNPGTKEEPLADFQAALKKAGEYRKNNKVSQPVEIIALEGEYSMLRPLELKSDDGGTPDSPLIFKAEKGTKAVFRGGIKLEGFEKINDRLWRTFVPQVAYYNSYFEQLYVNGRRAVRARTPNNGFYVVKGVSETVLEKGEGRFPKLAVQKVMLDSVDAKCFNSFTSADYQDALVVFYHKWDNTRKRITGFDNDSSSIYTVGEGMKPWNSIDKISRYYVDNYKAALDAPGEWFLDRTGYLYYIPQEGETIENTSFFAPVIKEFIVAQGDTISGKRVENIRFENLTFEVAGYLTPVDGNEPVQAAASVSAAVTLDFANNIEFSNCEIAHTGTYAFWFRRACSNCLVSQCYMHDLGAGGVKIGETIIRPDQKEITNNITIDNNIIRDGGHIFPCAVGIIIFQASDNKLTHNEIANLRYSGISVGWIWGYAYSPTKRNKVEFNNIHHLGWGELCDMGGVYTLGASEGTTVSNNVVHHVYSYDYGGWGLYTDEGSYGITMENNLVYACKNSGFHQHYGKENIIRNNIFALNIRAQLQATRVEDHRSISFTNNIIYFDKGSLLSSNWHKFNLLTDYNCYWDVRTKDIRFDDKSFAEWKKSGKDAHSIIADPLFVNPGKFDFHLKNLSVAKKIRFVPFDYSRAGVYGSEEWKKMAEPDPVIEKEFDVAVEKLEAKRIK
ncbi:MAG TPA: right-handed parallel beta-helix repeat-containing protein [Bacteroidales bacterium]|mgnify:CR=1 FL=1|nr:right-handed parallel beta-helix repeat-containing protein [Bacteroidales bacterium]